MADASIQSLSQAKEAEEKKIATLKARIQENRSRLVSFEDLQRNYEGYQEGVRAIMLKKQQIARPTAFTAWSPRSSKRRKPTKKH